MAEVTVALVQGEERATNVAAALAAIEESVDLSGCRHVLVKPNLVALDAPLACTHRDALRATLAFVRARYGGRLTIGEGSAVAHTPDGFERFGYAALAREFDAELIDLNADDTVAVRAYDRSLRPRMLHMARSVVESDFRISVGPPKTHDTVLVTLAIKNMVMGALVNRVVAAATPRVSSGRLGRLVARLLWRVTPPSWASVPLRGALSDKLLMHQGFPAINLNLALLAPLAWPQLAVIDGFRAMEGDGPIHGDAVEWRLALASCDALALDTLTAWLMGFELAEVGYLSYCAIRGLGVADRQRIAVCGNVRPEAVRRHFRRHPRADEQARWRHARAERLLAVG
jgi:uncharacterized protein (DUF362 family)